MTIPFQDLIDKEVRKDREPREQKSWHPSALGSCLRGAYFQRLGVKADTEFDDRTLRVFHCGNLFESWLVELIKKTELTIEEQVRVEDEKLNVSGYADIVASNKEGKKVYEVKSKHSRSFWYMVKKGEGAMLQHQMQLWLYLHLLGIDEGNIIYLSKDDLSFAEFPVLRNDERLERLVLNELELLNKAWEAKDPSILPLIEDEKDWRHKYCRYHQGHCLKVK